MKLSTLGLGIVFLSLGSTVFGSGLLGSVVTTLPCFTHQISGAAVLIEVVKTGVKKQAVNRGKWRPLSFGGDHTIKFTRSNELALSANFFGSGKNSASFTKPFRRWQHVPRSSQSKRSLWFNGSQKRPPNQPTSDQIPSMPPRSPKRGRAHPQVSPQETHYSYDHLLMKNDGVSLGTVFLCAGAIGVGGYVLKIYSKRCNLDSAVSAA